MAKEVIRVEGAIEEVLPDGFYRVKIIDEKYPREEPLLCKVAGRMKINFIKIIQGDYVTIEISPYDLTRGRIVYRHRSKPTVQRTESIPSTSHQ